MPQDAQDLPTPDVKNYKWPA